MVNLEQYRERIVSLKTSWDHKNPHLVVMQDGAPSNSASRTKVGLKQKNIALINWPVYFPNLKPMEDIWSLMKDFIENKYPDLPGDKERTQDELRMIFKEAWVNIKPGTLTKLVAFMPRRCRQLWMQVVE